MANKNERNPVLHVLLTIKDNKLLLILIISVLAFAFYWYELRPTIVRNSCLENAIQYANENTRDPNNLVLTDSELEQAKDNASQSAINDAMRNMKFEYVDGELKATGINEDRINKNRDWEGEAIDRMQSRAEMFARDAWERAAEQEYKKCMFSKGLEDNMY